MSTIIELPVSIGEALDKLTILEIKLDKINDERRKDVQKEYDAIKDKLSHLFTSDAEFHYKILKSVNLSIWEMQDEFKECKDEKQKINLCIKIIEDNDRRFRIKSKLNNLFNSALKEQKGYTKKKAFFLGHLGLGDNLTCVSIVRYLATLYDEVKVVCKQKYLDNLILFYSDDSSITFHPINDPKEICCVNYNCLPESFNEIVKGYDVYTCGLHKFKNPSFKDLPFCFYKDLDLSYTIFWKYFHIADLSESKELYLKVKDMQYIFIHNTSTDFDNTFNLDYVENKLSFNKNDILIINPNKNVYETGHKFFDIAQQFVNKPLSYYKDIIINAFKLIVCDSSFYCLVINLEIKTDECYYIGRYDADYSYIYNDTYIFDKKMNRKVFKNLLKC
jgi:hypothetical protein